MFLTRKVVVGGVFLIQHSSRDIRDIAACIALARNVNLEVLDSECEFKVLEEFDKVLRNLLFGGGSDVSNGKASTNRLLDPAYVLVIYAEYDSMIELSVNNLHTIACW